MAEIKKGAFYTVTKHTGKTVTMSGAELQQYLIVMKPIAAIDFEPVKPATKTKKVSESTKKITE
jgi:hypothetical protein